MKKNKVFLCLSLLFLVSSLVSCSMVLFSSYLKTSIDNRNEMKHNVSVELANELDELSSIDEVRNFYNLNIANNVDPSISYEFAQLWLDEAVKRGEYSSESILIEKPIPIYSPNGKIKYYEFIISEYGKSVGYITGTATKDIAVPILFDSKFSGHSADLNKLRDRILNENALIRLVDNGYPSVVFGLCSDIDFPDIKFIKFYGTEYLDEMPINSIKHVCNYEEIREILPKLITDSFSQVQAKSITEEDRLNISTFWEAAEGNRGKIHLKANTTLEPKFNLSSRNEIDYNNIKKTMLLTNNSNHIANYGACGPVCEGFILDYLQANMRVYTSWSDLRLSEKMNTLYDKLYTGRSYAKDAIDFVGQDGDSLTLPNDMGNAIKEHSEYKLKLNFSTYPKTSINNNLPGISLRTLSDGGMHYRNVIAYKTNGWGPFVWPSIKILDLVDSKNLKEGSWETFVPIYHLLNWNVVKK